MTKDKQEEVSEEYKKQSDEQIEAIADRLVNKMEDKRQKQEEEAQKLKDEEIIKNTYESVKSGKVFEEINHISDELKETFPDKYKLLVKASSTPLEALSETERYNLAHVANDFIQVSNLTKKRMEKADDARKKKEAEEEKLDTDDDAIVNTIGRGGTPRASEINESKFPKSQKEIEAHARTGKRASEKWKDAKIAINSGTDEITEQDRQAQFVTYTNKKGDLANDIAIIKEGGDYDNLKSLSESEAHAINGELANHEYFDGSHIERQERQDKLRASANRKFEDALHHDNTNKYIIAR